MARNRFRSDTGLTFRMGGVSFALGALYVAFAAVLLSVYGDQPGGAVVVVLIVGGMAWSQWYFSDTLALKSMGAREVSPEQAPELHAMIDRLCALADMPKPRVAVAETHIPNAFATGRSPNHSAVCVTTGILQRLNADELEGVLAHELAHVGNRDVTVMTVASTLGMLAGLITRWGLHLGGGNRNRNGALAFIVIFMVSMVVYALSFVLTRALSRYRELSADRSGAYLTGRPSQLASALSKITGEMAQIPTEDLRETGAVSAFFFAGGVSQLFSTHPPLEKRLAQLSQISAELGEH
ncbi:MAG: zinc metalloprotease HtpX [Aeromicrobium sp.]|uniref:zinc metalloprotease HtpX n=1 Tax=Aeromicrobium sp. TaxID=1871063 RepID=UPI0039E69310